jgi:hypothetical protein
VLGDSCAFNYVKTKKIAVVSSRDQYMMAQTRRLEASKSPNGKKCIYIALKSKDLPDYPPIDGVVRIQTILTGFYLVELEPNLVEIHFYLESDAKISMFIAKQVMPKSSNYANLVREFIESNK